jgi:cbb3-type cytochrome c oxidase subunit III
MKRIMLLISLLVMPVLFLTLTGCTEQAPTSGGSVTVSKESKEGAAIYEEKCLQCHGENAQGGICPNLVDKEWKYGSTDEDIYKSIAEGRPGGMPNWNKTLSDEKIKSVITYIRSLDAN